jgi:toxin FitB
MNVVDSSGWLEFFTNGKNADFFKPAITDEKQLAIPTICLYEVFKFILLHKSEEEALHVIGLMSFGRIVDIDREIALMAADLSIKHKLAMADSLILAAARACDATLWTQDEHFNGIQGVKYIQK